MFCSRRASTVVGLRNRLLRKACESRNSLQWSGIRPLSGLSAPTAVMSERLQIDHQRQKPTHRSFSSISDPYPSLFHAERLSPQLDPDVSDLDKQLRSDVRTMGATLGKIIQEHSGTEVFHKVEKLRNFAKVSVPMLKEIQKELF